MSDGWCAGGVPAQPRDPAHNLAQCRRLVETKRVSLGCSRVLCTTELEGGARRCSASVQGSLTFGRYLLPSVWTLLPRDECNRNDHNDLFPFSKHRLSLSSVQAVLSVLVRQGRRFGLWLVAVLVRAVLVDFAQCSFAMPLRQSLCLLLSSQRDHDSSAPLDDSASRAQAQVGGPSRRTTPFQLEVEQLA